MLIIKCRWQIYRYFLNFFPPTFCVFETFLNKIWGEKEN